ncbi:MAG: hypothetical protein ACREO8_01910 [Luteimonas sp.]
MKTPINAADSSSAATALALALAATLVLAACGRMSPPASVTDAQGNTVTEWRLPAAAGAAQPDLSLAPDGRVLLSWIKPFDRRKQALQFTSFDRQGQWQWAPKTIAVGGSMVVNWADTPHIAATADGSVWAHWLQRTRSGASADAGEGHAGHQQASYDIVVAQSTDAGMHWGTPIRAHNDGQAVEHGFVSFWPAARDRIGIAWLDGRNTVTGGMTALRSANIDAAPRVLDDEEVDASVCDCCGTDVAMTASGPLLVYRDRTADEIRDIYVTRRTDNAWRTPAAVHADGWKMAACPVNGPAVAARGDSAVVAWYTAANDLPMLKLARSGNAGDSFAAPVIVDQGDAVQGRTDVALDDAQAWVAWLREDAAGQSLWIARYAPDLSRQLARIEVAKLSGRGRGTGFPKLVVRDGEAFVVWTDIANGASQLRGARISHR